MHFVASTLTATAKVGGKAEKAKAPPTAPVAAAPPRTSAPPAAPATVAVNTATPPAVPQSAPSAAATAPPPAATPPAAAGGVASTPAGAWTFSTWWAYAKSKYLPYLVTERIELSKVLFAYADEAADKRIPEQVATQVWSGIVESYKAAIAPQPAPSTNPITGVAPAPAPPIAGPPAPPKDPLPAVPGVVPPAQVKVALPEEVNSPPPADKTALPAVEPPPEMQVITPTPEAPVTIELIPNRDNIRGKAVSGPRGFDDPLYQPDPPIATPRTNPPPASTPPTQPAEGGSGGGLGHPTNPPSSSGGSTPSGDGLGHPTNPPASPGTGSADNTEHPIKIEGVSVFVQPQGSTTAYYLFAVSKSTRAVVLQDPHDKSFRAARFADMAIWGVMMGDKKAEGVYLMRAPTPAEIQTISALFNQGQTERAQAVQEARGPSPLLVLAGLYLAMR